LPDLIDQAPESEDIEAEDTRSAFEKLSEEAQSGLQDCLRHALEEDRTDRRDEVRMAWHLRLYCKGRQHLFWDSKSYSYQSLADSGEALPRYMGTYDITTPHKRSFVSILSESTLGVNFEPDNLQIGRDVTAAKLAEKGRDVVDRMIPMRSRQAKAAGYLCTDGRVVAWTRLDKDGKLCFSLHGVPQAKVPIHAQEKEDWDFCVLSREVGVWKAKKDNPDYADQIEATAYDATSAYERYARLSIVAKTGRTGGSLKSLVTEHDAWIDPCRFLKLEDDIQEELDAAFPEGVHIHAFGDTIVDAMAENMDCLAVEFPVDDEGQARPALLAGMIDIQDAYNDIKNMMLEAAEYSNPATWVHNGAVDSEAIPEQRSEPGAIHLITPPAGMSVPDCVTQEQPVQISAQAASMLDMLKQDGENTTGDFPQLHGEDVSGQDTVGVNKLLTNQAKGQLGPAWAALQRLWAKVYPVAIKLIAQQGETQGTSGPQGKQTVNLSAILDGNFGCSPDGDSSFPETTADKRASLATVTSDLAAAGPDGLAILMHPDNLKYRSQLSGLTDFVIIQAEARDKQLEEIEQMLEEPPVPDESQMQQYMQTAQQAMASGSQPPPPPMKSSIPVGKRDFHAYEVAKGNEWLSSNACRDALRNGKGLGVQNIMLHLDEHDAAIQAAQAPPHVEPPKVNLTMQVTDPNTIAQFAQAAGATTTSPQDIASSQVPDQQEQAAKTQHAAAQAQHTSVLAAKEAVEPAGGFARNKPKPVAPKGGLDAT
jgi:hypothetical protein